MFLFYFLTDVHLLDLQILTSQPSLFDLSFNFSLSCQYFFYFLLYKTQRLKTNITCKLISVSSQKYSLSKASYNPIKLGLYHRKKMKLPIF